MAKHKLILTPANPDQAPRDVPALLASLRRLGFTGEPFQLAGRTHYLPGKRFLDLVTFLGCSPVILLEPPEDARTDPGIQADKFCHVGLWYAGEQPVFLAGGNTLSPRCRHCRQPQARWQLMISAWESDPSNDQWHCSECANQSRPYELDWRQSAGFGRFFIEIWGIYPAEAVPGEVLLETLSQSTDGPWGFFYLEADKRPFSAP